MRTRLLEVGDTSLHGSFFPSDVYPGEGVYAVLTDVNGVELSPSAQLRIWRISPLGVEVIVDGVEPQLNVGDSIRLLLHLGSVATNMGGVLVDISSDAEGRALASIRFVVGSAGGQERGKGDRRKSRRWLCHDMYMPTSVWKHPARFNEFVFARVRDISARGARLTTSMRNKFLVKGVRFQAFLNFPLVGQTMIEFEISNLSLTTEMGKDFLSVGVEFVNVTASAREKIAQYLNQFASDANPKNLMRDGLLPSSVSDGVHYSYVRTEAEYLAVLELRRRTYVAIKKISEEVSVVDMGSPLDTRARIIMGVYKGKVIATATLVFHEYHDEMELEDDVEWPSDFPRKENCVEIIRLCIDGGYRGSDVLLSLMNFMALTVVQSGKEYVVFGATDAILPTYEKMGMLRSRLVYEHSKLANLRHTVVVVRMRDLLGGKTMGPLYWNVVWGDVAKFLLSEDGVMFNRLERLRISLYRLCKPFCFMLGLRKDKPRVVFARRKIANMV